MSKVAGSGLVALGTILAASSTAQAQSTAVSGTSETDSVAVGQWQIRPSLQLRTRAEFRRNPFDVGGAAIPSNSLSSGAAPRIEDQWLVMNRGRIGLRADHDYLRAAIEVQDARVWGETSPSNADSRDSLPTTSARVAYAEIHSRGQTPSFLRVGRQEIAWGDGRLIGRNDLSLTGRSLDAARGQLSMDNVDVEAFASILSPAGALPLEARRDTSGRVEGTGAQLYGLKLAWNLVPLLKLEAQGLARFVRIPADSITIPSDLYVGALRVSGASSAISYALEGAVQGGQIAIVDDTTRVQAYAAAAKAEWATRLAWNLTLGAQAAYASGQKRGDSKVTRFEPLLADTRTNHGHMNLIAWSNAIDAGGHLRVSPFRETELQVGYRHLALAQASDQWISGNLVAIGNAANSNSRSLGNEIDVAMSYAPHNALRLAIGYGAFLTGAAAKEILRQAGRGEPALQHFGYAQLTMNVP